MRTAFASSRPSSSSAPASAASSTSSTSAFTTVKAGSVCCTTALPQAVDDLVDPLLELHERLHAAQRSAQCIHVGRVHATTLAALPVRSEIGTGCGTAKTGSTRRKTCARQCRETRDAHLLDR